MKKHRTFIIAEAGVNHNGSILIAKKLIDNAKAGGADAIKFQTFKAEKLVSKSAHKAAYQKKTTSRSESHFDMLRRLELDEDDHRELINHCRKRKITFLSSPFDEASADFLDKLGVRVFKVPSGELTNLPLLQHIAKKNKPIIMSTGMSTLNEVRDALNIILRAGNNRVTLLHCVTEYPAPFKEINLRAMLTLKESFGLPVGYSDHTEGIEVAIAAVAMGAQVIEKHFTLDRNMDGPDHRASIDPLELKQMIKAIRNVEMSLGNGAKNPAPCELKNINVARKSIVAIRDIGKGERIMRADLTVKRPGSGIQPKDLNKVLGHVARCAIKADEVITWGKVS